MKPRIRVPANFGKEHINSPVHGNIRLKLKDGQEIKVNSIIMSLNSPVIDNLTSNLTQSTLEMDDFTNSAVDCFVESMYTGDVEKLEKLNFEDVNKMAHVFKVGWLSKRCLLFYETDILKFENNSYREIEFACEIASRAHFHLKQKQFVGLFVKHVTFDEVVSKNTFLQRYLADLATVPRHRIDTSLVIAGEDLNIIGNCLTAYLYSAFERGKMDENALSLLQKLDIRKFSQSYPSELNEIINFLSDKLEKSDSTACDEVKSAVKDFIKRGKTYYENKKEVVDDVRNSGLQDYEDVEDMIDLGCRDVETQTTDMEAGTSSAGRTLSGSICLKGQNGKYLGANRDGSTSCSSTTNGPEEVLEVVNVNSYTELVALKSKYGKFLTAQKSHSLIWHTDVVKSWELFKADWIDANTITLKSFHGRYISAQSNSRGRIHCNKEKALEWEQFIVEEPRSATSVGGRVYLKSYHGKYLGATFDDRATCSSATTGTHYGTEEIIEVVVMETGQVSLKSFFGKFLSAQPNHSLQWDRENVGDWERFQLDWIDENRITLKSYHGRYLTAFPSGFLICNVDSPGDREQFTVERVSQPESETAGTSISCRVIRTEEVERTFSVRYSPVNDEYLISRDSEPTQFVHEFSSLAYRSENVARKVKTDSWNIVYAYLARKTLDDSIITWRVECSKPVRSARIKMPHKTLHNGRVLWSCDLEKETSKFHGQFSNIDLSKLKGTTAFSITAKMSSPRIGVDACLHTQLFRTKLGTTNSPFEIHLEF